MNAVTFRLLALAFSVTSAFAADYPAPAEGDYTIRDFKFASGENVAGVADSLSDAREDRQGCERECA